MSQMNIICCCFENCKVQSNWISKNYVSLTMSYIPFLKNTIKFVFVDHRADNYCICSIKFNFVIRTSNLLPTEYIFRSPSFSIQPPLFLHENFSIRLIVQATLHANELSVLGWILKLSYGLKCVLDGADNNGGCS